MQNSAMRLTQEQQEQIIAIAKSEAEPWIKIMNEITKFSIPSAIIKPDGTFIVKYSHEENETYIAAKGMVQTIFERAQRKLNK